MWAITIAMQQVAAMTPRRIDLGTFAKQGLQIIDVTRSQNDIVFIGQKSDVRIL